MIDRPTRQVAVALSFDPQGDAVPTVVAAGHGVLAEKILAMAFAAGIPVRRDEDLAAVLDALEPESPIPPAAFAAVAEILAHLYRLNGRLGETNSTGGRMAGQDD
ncbi:EscU/YscU/HrcU family type III secretion system export apparatus switch protein [Tistrella bauzanensis]|uniref:EscU/YscU/HrcU family type III secretion system export apparatus switch protein n=1 Tax=Tistrella arctica TaxID=3133430 RepID=A0ABU9YI75_9PROT